MSLNHALSSEQALKDYFSALLDESPEELELAQEISVEPEPEISKSLELVPQLKQVEAPLLPMVPLNEVEAPSLGDIQRLLDRLENSDPLGNLNEIEALIEQNTLNLNTVVKVDVEEIQDWDIETVDSAAVAETFPDPVIAQADVIEDKPIELKELAEPEPLADTDATTENINQLETETDVSHALANEVSLEPWQSTERNHAFQVLFFDVYGVTFAVPLDELGGIHRLEETNHLIGRPSWYLGLQTNKENQLDVVDTAKWVMADKLADDTYKETYQYIVMLGESLWGLASGALKGTELIEPEEVRWRSTASKRPWLAGMVKEKMCALIHVEALIHMLNAGQDVKALDK